MAKQGYGLPHRQIDIMKSYECLETKARLKSNTETLLSSSSTGATLGTRSIEIRIYQIL